EGGQGVDHAVNGVGQGGNLALGLHRQLLLQVAVGHGGHHPGNAADLGGQVTGHKVDVVGEVLPHPGHAADLSLSAELPLGADLAGDAGHLRGEAGELVDHRVDGVLQLQNLTLHVHGDLLRQLAAGDDRRHLRDVPYLPRLVARHQVDVVGEALPRPGRAADVGLSAELALGADLAGDAGHLGGEAGQLVHHRVDRVLQLQDLAPY